MLLCRVSRLVDFVFDSMRCIATRCHAMPGGAQHCTDTGFYDRCVAQPGDAALSHAMQGAALHSTVTVFARLRKARQSIAWRSTARHRYSFRVFAAVRGIASRCKARRRMAQQSTDTVLYSQRCLAPRSTARLSKAQHSTVKDFTTQRPAWHCEARRGEAQIHIYNA